MTDAERIREFEDELWRQLKENQGSATNLTPLQRASVCLMNFQAAVNNGGLYVYFYNSAGDFAQETPAVMRQIGADDAAHILDQANAIFDPEGPPADRIARCERLLALPPDAKERIEQLTSDFFTLEDRGLCLADMFDAYVLDQFENDAR